MNTIYSYLTAMALGPTIIIGGISLNTQEILNDANRSANKANLHQIATVLELYYMDHDSYPEVEGGEQLVETLFEGGYIKTKPLDASVFTYASKQRGQDYDISVIEK